jgi:hypothetical protein
MPAIRVRRGVGIVLQKHDILKSVDMRVKWMRLIQVTKIPRKREMLLWANLRAANENHQVLQQRPVNLVKYGC